MTVLAGRTQGSTVATTRTVTALMAVGIHLHLTGAALDQERGCRPGREARMPSLHDPHHLSITTVVVDLTRTVIETAIETDHHHGAGRSLAAGTTSILISRATEIGTVTAIGTGTAHPVTDDTMTGCARLSHQRRSCHMEATLPAEVILRIATVGRAADRPSPEGYLTESGKETADRDAADLTVEVSKASTSRLATRYMIHAVLPANRSVICLMMIDRYTNCQIEAVEIERSQKIHRRGGEERPSGHPYEMEGRCHQLMVDKEAALLTLCPVWQVLTDCMDRR